MPAQFHIEGIPGVLHTDNPDVEPRWNGFAVPAATPREIARYLFDLAQVTPKEEWADFAALLGAEYAPDLSVFDSEEAKDIPAAPSGIMWEAVEGPCHCITLPGPHLCSNCPHHQQWDDTNTELCRDCEAALEALHEKLRKQHNRPIMGQ